MVIGAVIIKHKLCLSDEEAVQQIRENFYLQYFVVFSTYQDKQPFSPSLFVEIRRRMGEQNFAHFHQVIVNVMTNRAVFRLEKSKEKCNLRDDDDTLSPDLAFDQDTHKIEEASAHQGKLTLDATTQW